MNKWVPIGCYALLLAIGLAFVIAGLMIPAKAALAQHLLLNAWQEVRGGKTDAKPWPWADTWPIAKLTVDGESTLVLSDAGGESLAFGPSNVSGSALPGTKGTSVISAHRDTHFVVLKEVKMGDIVTIERADGVTHGYKIHETYILSKLELSISTEDRLDRLILVTCWPFDAVNPNTRKRFVVVGEQIPQSSNN
jgi:sortase A